MHRLEEPHLVVGELPGDRTVTATPAIAATTVSTRQRSKICRATRQGKRKREEKELNLHVVHDQYSQGSISVFPRE